MFKKLKRYVRDPYYALGYDMIEKCPHLMSDKFYLSILWKMVMGYELDWKHPKTFNEKLQWLKLYDRNPLYTTLVDKYRVKQWVADKIGEQYVIPTLAVYNSVDEIDLDKLPSQFVLKCNHDSGSMAICKDKAVFDLEVAKQKLDKGLKHNMYWDAREWVYKNVDRVIIAEPFIDTLGKPESIEYKITCIDGKVKMITVCSGIAHVEYDKRFNDHFDLQGNRLPFYVYYKPAGLDLPEKELVKEMVSIAETLSEGIPQVRVDLYYHNKRFYFGEMTFYTWGGMMDYEPKEWDRIMGDWLKLPIG